jgi:hypothetical protein
MTTNPSLEFYMRLVIEKHKALISASHLVIRTLAGNDPDQKKAVANTALQAATDLRAILSKNDVPLWLVEVACPRFERHLDKVF